MLVSGVDVLDDGNGGFTRTIQLRFPERERGMYKFPFFWFIKSDTSRLMPRFGS